jgi:hypothetical protein
MQMLTEIGTEQNTTTVVMMPERFHRGRAHPAKRRAAFAGRSVVCFLSATSEAWDW